jgi:hypothetical protein
VAKKILIILLFLFSFAKAQILSYNFDYFSPDTNGAGSACWILDSTFIADRISGSGSELTDRIGAYDLTANGFSAGLEDETTTGSIISRNGNMIVFNGSSEYFTNSSGDLDGNTSDIVLQCWFETPDISGGTKFVANKRSATEGYETSAVSSTIQSKFHKDGANTVAASAENSRVYYSWTKWDRDGNLTLAFYNSDSLIGTDTLDISAHSADDNWSASDFTIGAYSATPTSFEWDGKIGAVKFSKGTLLSDKILIDDAFLADGWTSAVGLVSREGFGWNQGIKYTTFATVALGLKDGVDSTLGAVTTDSTRYTIQIADITSLSSDSLLFRTNTDSIWYPLPDSTFAAGRAIQVVFDGWKDDNYVYIDNVTVTTYEANAVPVITSTSPDTTVVGLPYSYTATATDGDADPITFAYDLNPSWSSASGAVLSGTPPTATDTSFRVIATDGSNNDTLVVTLVVNPAATASAIRNRVGSRHKKYKNFVKR